MSIWVSRYANKKLREEGWYPVGISIGTPKYPLGYEVREQCYSLAPKGYMLNMEYEPYRKAYFEKLNAIGKDSIIRTVKRLDERAKADGKELVLLCFEDIRNEGEWCHRTLFAEWWMEHTGEIIEELDDPTPAKKPKRKPEIKNEEKEPEKPSEPEPVQLDLFSLGLI